MKKLIFALSLCLYSLFPIPYSLQAQVAGEHVEVTAQDMEAMLNPPVPDDSLRAAANDLDALIAEGIRRYKNEDTRPVDLGSWVTYLLAMLGSLIAFMKKWGKTLTEKFKEVKGDTIAYIVSAAIGIAWMLLDGGSPSVAEWFAKFSAVFTLAVGAYKLVLQNVWEWLRGLFTKAPQPGAGA